MKSFSLITRINTMRLFILLILLTGTGTFAQQVPIIPLPNKYLKLDGTFTLSGNTPIITDDEAFRSQANFLQQEMLKTIDLNLNLQKNSVVPSIVLSKLKSSGDAPGAYRLMITGKQIRISAASEEGLFYGINSLMQLVRQAALKGKPVVVNSWDIRDQPKYSWRGLMLDESRHFFGKETVKFLLDWMAFYKLNRFHWHLSDEPGWRMEIKKYPKLALVGGIGNFTDPFAPAKYYTQEDIKEIIAYARERFIMVIPEIDMPGHAGASNKAYPQFSGGGSEMYPDFTFNPAKKEVYDYLSDILKETNSLFPSDMIHLGGDEVHFGNENWNKDADVQQLMKEKKMPDLKAVEQYFIQRMADSLAKMNNKVLLWDEAVGSSLSPENTIIFWWRHDKPEQLKLALSKNFPVVLTPRLPFYFDFVQDSTHRVGRRWQGGFNTLKNVYNFSPASYYRPDQAPLILGIQAAIWTERISNPDKLDHMLFPRISALAETGWTDEKHKDYNAFEERVKSHMELYRKGKIYFYNQFIPLENPEPRIAGAKDN